MSLDRSYGRKVSESNKRALKVARPGNYGREPGINPGDRTSAYNAHIEQLLACCACPNVFAGAVVQPVPHARIMLVGQAPGSHELIDRRPFAYTAGKRLFAWFESTGVSEENFRAYVHIGAVLRCFPGKARGGGDRVPDPVEIARCGEHLDRELRILRPRLVIAVGALAAQQLVGDAVLSRVVGVLHRAERADVGFDLVVMPHPSGRSTWLNRTEHAALLAQSLDLISNHEAFRKTFFE